MSDFNNMNDCANRKLLTHATEKHQKALGETRMKHKNEMNNLQKKNIHLLQDLSNQSRFIASLKSLNSDFGQTIASMVNLISEKDQVRLLHVGTSISLSICIILTNIQFIWMDK